MPDIDVIIAKVGNIQRSLQRIKSVTNLAPTSLDDIDKQDIFILNLQRAIESAIVILQHISPHLKDWVCRQLQRNFSYCLRIKA